MVTPIVFDSHPNLTTSYLISNLKCVSIYVYRFFLCPATALCLDHYQCMHSTLKQPTKRFSCILPCCFPTDNYNATKVTLLRNVSLYVTHPPAYKVLNCSLLPKRKSKLATYHISHISYPSYTKPLEFTKHTGLFILLKLYTCCFPYL